MHGRMETQAEGLVEAKWSDTLRQASRRLLQPILVLPDDDVVLLGGGEFVDDHHFVLSKPRTVVLTVYRDGWNGAVEGALS